MYGWTGNILHIDVTRERFWTETPGTDFYTRHIGGKGMGGAYLLPCARLAHNDPDMVFSVFTGPLTATIAPTSGRCHFVSKSPLTGLVGDASVGGKLAFELKRAGWDGMVITGRGKLPVGIDITDGQVAFLPAGALWGKDTRTVYQKLNPGKASLACIGPAAENGVRFASVTVDQHHAAGRTGLGTSLSAKNIKYIKIRGTGRTRVKDNKALKDARGEILRLTAASPALMGRHGFTRLGTGAVYDLMAARRMMPTDNFLATHFKPAPALNAAEYVKMFQPRNFGCKGCHVLCKKIGKKDGMTMPLPEFETMSHFTALIGCEDKNLVMDANRLCNLLGMDTISAASVLACRREITREDYTRTTLLSLLEDIALGQGEGPALRHGAVAYAGAMGRPEAAMAVKGMELPAYDPRGAYGMALGYALSTRGGCHLRAYPISHEIFRKPVATDRFSFSGKARIIKIAEDLNAVVDSLIACKFTFFAAGLEEYAKAYTAVTGLETTAQDLLAAGERIYYNERIINSRNGFDARHDDLPLRFFSQKGSSGNQIRIPPISRQNFLTARQRYYTIRGLSPDGLPVKEKAESLGIPWTEA